ncbi:MAG: TRAP transporter large permease subunit [Desulfuromonadales bacterium]|nr:TRAP transporter large permease subunit [Desulfuromonadales bacterium]NIR33611.1 TRAP transporter large permease subunit [Desulfuromonadales bacterium]NIS43988.1 TRAP transporter large permease subunit [Desulfuromonadales bacterium]
MEIALTLTILAVALILFATEWIRMDLVSLMILLALGLTGLVTPQEAFSGFSNPAVITVAAMFIISAGISNTGAVNQVGEKILDFTGQNEIRLIISLMLTVAFFSAFINNIGATAVLMPVVIGIARRLHMPPSKLLMPLAFGSLLGGVCTLIGTPPNILMNELLQEYTGESFSMFHFTPVGVVVLIAGVVYMALIGRHLLPKRKAGTLTEAYQVKEYITEVEILEGSPLAGQTISKTNLENDFDLKVRAILRDKQKIPFPRRNRKLMEKDIIFLEGNPEGILKVRKKKGLEVVPERDNPVEIVPDEDLVVVEASLTPTSDMVGKTLREVRFAHTYGLTVLAIWRSGAPVVKKVDHVVLKFGDVLLIQGAENRVKRLGELNDFLLLGGIAPASYHPRKAPFALAVLLGVVLAASSGLLPIMLSATLGALTLVLGRCLTTKEAYEAIDWSIIILIAGTLPLGYAMERSGAAKLLADFIISLNGPFGPWVLLAALFLVTFLLTAIMSNAASAVLISPIAYNAALELGVSPQPFFMAVAVAASTSFMTPISHQSNALVMGPGGYHFLDYTKVGTPLNIVVWILSTLIIPLIFPF